ncbi:MAG: rod shape-determining protein RodA [Balneolales bacterium]
MNWYKQFDWPLLICYMLLSVIGLTAIYSATQGPVSDYLPDYIQGNFKNQMSWIFLSLLLLISVQFTTPMTFQQISYVFYAGCLIIGILTIFMGVEVGGARGWFVIGGLRIQISEMMKLATVLAVANYLTSRRNISAERFRPALIVVLLMLLPAGIIVLQNDTGTALIIIALIPVMLFWSGLPHGISLFMITPALVAYFTILNWQWGIITALILSVVLFFVHRRPGMPLASFIVGLFIVIGIQVALHQILQPYQQARIEAFVNPAIDPHGAGWNVIQAKTAIGSGGMFGKGFMEGTQTQLRFLPEQWTDFIFCVIGEEFGFLGAGAVLFLLGFLVLRLLSNAADHKHPFAQLVMVGVAAIFFIQIFINIGSATGLMPVIGLPLPLLSYGGSSFMSCTLMIAICLNLHLYRRQFSIYA